MAYVSGMTMGRLLGSTGLGAMVLAVAAMAMPLDASAREHGRFRVQEGAQEQNSGGSGEHGGGFQNRGAEWRAQRIESRGHGGGGGEGMSMRARPMPQMSVPVQQAPVMQSQGAANPDGGGWRGGGGGWRGGNGGGGWRDGGSRRGNGGGWQNGQSGQSAEPQQTWRERAPRQDGGTWQSRNGGTWQPRGDGVVQPRPERGWRSPEGQTWRYANRERGWRNHNNGDNGSWRNRGGNGWRDRVQGERNPHAEAQRRYGEWRYDQSTDTWRPDGRGTSRYRDANRWRDNGQHYSGNHRNWDRRWRENSRYDWHGYRKFNRDRYRLGRYHAPYYGYSYSRIGIGFSLGSLFYSDRYWIDDPWQYRLPEVYGPYRWVRYYDDVLLVNIYTGEVVDVIYDFFW